jgi:hypothetical protein
VQKCRCQQLFTTCPPGAVQIACRLVRALKEEEVTSGAVDHRVGEMILERSRKPDEHVVDVLEVRTREIADLRVPECLFVVDVRRGVGDPQLEIVRSRRLIEDQADDGTALQVVQLLFVRERAVFSHVIAEQPLSDRARVEFAVGTELHRGDELALCDGLLDLLEADPGQRRELTRLARVTWASGITEGAGDEHAGERREGHAVLGKHAVGDNEAVGRLFSQRVVRVQRDDVVPTRGAHGGGHLLPC